jgi:uroporphyrinogen decarboxylase
VIHFGTGTGAFLEEMASVGAQAIGVDYRVSLKDAWKRIGHDKAIQGNLDPLVLFSDRAFIQKRVKAVLDEAEGRPGHLFNLGHGILPETPFDNVKYLIEAVRDLSRR